MPDLTGINPFPNDNDAAATTDVDRRRRAAGERLVHGPSRGSRSPAPTTAGRLRRRADPVPDQRRHAAAATRGPFDLTTEGEHHARVPRGRPRRQRRDVQGVDAQGRPERAHDHRHDLPGQRARRAAGTTARSRSACAPATAPGSGTEATRVPRQPDGDEDDVAAVRGRVPGRRGGRERRRVPLGRTSPATSRTTKSLQPAGRRDRAGDGGAHQRRGRRLAEYTGAGARRVHAHRRATGSARSRPSTASATASGRPTRARSTSPAIGGYRVDFRSIDLAGNVENFKTVIVRDPAARRPVGATPNVQPQAHAGAGAARRSRRWRRSPRRCGRCPPCAAASSGST